MKADLLYLGAGYTVSRSKPFQGGGNVTGTETVPELKLSQISNNCHNCLNRATHDQGSFKEVHLNNHKELWHETNFHRSTAYPFITKAWNYWKSFTDEEVMNFTSWRFLSPSICEYLPLEEKIRQTKKRPGPKSIIDLKRNVLGIQQAKNQEKRPSEVEDIIIFPKPVIRSLLWKDCIISWSNHFQTEIWLPGHTLHDPRIPEDIPEEFIWTTMKRNRRIFMANNFPFSAMFTLGGVNEFSLQLFEDQRPYSFICRLSI